MFMCEINILSFFDVSIEIYLNEQCMFDSTTLLETAGGHAKVTLIQQGHIDRANPLTS